MYLSRFMLLTLAQKLDCMVDEFSVVYSKMDYLNGMTFWCIVDGEDKIQQVRTKFK